MKIGIIGSGRIGTAVGKRWINAGHEVMFGSRDPNKAKALAAEIGKNATGGSYQDAAAFGDVLLLATPWTSTREVIASLPSLAGKIIIETTNNFTGQDNEISTTEHIANWASGAKVFKAFNTIFVKNLQGEPRTPRITGMFAGDDAAAKAVVTQLISDAGLDPLDSGSLKDARHLDNLGQFLVHLGYGMNKGAVSYTINPE